MFIQIEPPHSDGDIERRLDTAGGHRLGTYISRKTGLPDTPIGNFLAEGTLDLIPPTEIRLTEDSLEIRGHVLNLLLLILRAMEDPWFGGLLEMSRRSRRRVLRNTEDGTG